MSFLDRIFGRRQTAIAESPGLCCLRSVEAAAHLRRPVEPNWSDEAQGPCKHCGKPLRELLITTGGTLGDKAVWRDVPVSVDGWACPGCGVFHYPRKMSPDAINGFLSEGAKAGQAGDFETAEWWFTRVVWDWPGFVAGHLNLAEATRERLHQSAELSDDIRRRLIHRMREQYEVGVAAWDKEPNRESVAAVARAYLTLARLAVDDRAFDRARRALDGCRALGPVNEEVAKELGAMSQGIEQRWDLFHSAAAVLSPFFHLQDRRGQRIEDGEARKSVQQAIADLEAHYRLAPDHWQAAWILAKGSAALKDNEATLERWRAAWKAHPGVPDIARELGLALHHADLNAEALPVARATTEAAPGDATLWANRALAELLEGNVAEARRCVDMSLGLDPKDAITRHVEGRIARCEQTGVVPRTLKELQRAG